jgi:SSS family solute:Na+ symporter
LGLGIAHGAGSSVLELWVGIVMQLFPAFLVPFALRWFWARFNGAGFSAGIAAGFAAAAWFWLARPSGWNEATQFRAVAGASFAASVSCTLATKPVSESTLADFYRQVRPFGLWPERWRDGAEEHDRDLKLSAVALGFQVLTFLIPMGVLLKMWPSVAAASPLWLGLAYILWRSARPPRSSPPPRITVADRGQSWSLSSTTSSSSWQARR